MNRRFLFGVVSHLGIAFLLWTFFHNLVPFAALATGVFLYAALETLLGRLRLPWWVDAAAALFLPFVLRGLVFGFLFLIDSRGVNAWDRLFPLFDRWAVPGVAAGLLAWLFFTVERRKEELIPWLHLFRSALVVGLFTLQDFGPMAWWGHPLPALISAGLALSWELLGLHLWQRDRQAPVHPALLALLLPLLAGGSAVSFQLYSGDSASEQAGLMQPTLFGFDFAPIVQLESEIRLEKDLVLVLRREGWPANQLLRRQVLSGYDQESGFFLDQSSTDFMEMPLTVSGSVLELPAPKGEARVEVKHDIFVVNIEPSGVLALNEPHRVTPLTGWDRARFRGAYRVHSRVAPEGSYRIAASPEEAGLSNEEWAYYTRAGDDPRVADLARRVTAGLPDSPTIKTREILDYLKENFYYSLKPGVAVGMPPLHHFLFESQKGYCSYFAFSMALMLRSLGIPSRVAVGFLADRQTEVFGFYPVRAFQAHAWVEVISAGQGWVPYDPTSTTLAPGETWNPNFGGDEAFLELIEAILGTDMEMADLPTDVVSGRQSEGGLPAWVLFCALALAVAGFLAYRLRRRWRLALEPSERERVALRYWWGRVHLEAAGYPADAALPPMEFAFEVADPKWTALTELYLRVLYSEVFPFGADESSRLALTEVRKAHPIQKWWRLVWH